MIIDTENINPAFVEMVNKPDQVFFLDANIIIPPDRSTIKDQIKPYRFEDYKDGFLEPLFQEFSHLAVHESVYEELVSSSIKGYLDTKRTENPTRIEVHYDKVLSDEECKHLAGFLNKLSIYSKYDPRVDNAKDRGEIRSLSYMAVRKYLYFAANDALAIRLINNAKELKTGLDDMGVIQLFELLFFLHTRKKYEDKKLKFIYRYIYHLTKRDKSDNPEWGGFIANMEQLYRDICV